MSQQITLAVQNLGGEEFLAFLMTAGMMSSLVSYAGRLSSLSSPNALTRSLGASGAEYACFAAVAIIYPGMRTTT